MHIGTATGGGHKKQTKFHATALHLFCEFGIVTKEKTCPFWQKFRSVTPLPVCMGTASGGGGGGGVHRPKHII
jgi:hypothetical protein